jgi:hypothetical protein
MGQNGSRPIPYFCHAWKKVATTQLCIIFIFFLAEVSKTNADLENKFIIYQGKL